MEFPGRAAQWQPVPVDTALKSMLDAADARRPGYDADVDAGVQCWLASTAAGAGSAPDLVRGESAASSRIQPLVSGTRFGE